MENCNETLTPETSAPLNPPSEIRSDQIAETTEASAYGNICTLIREKTRFEPGDVENIKEQEDGQAFSLEARYELEARVEQCEINGFFRRTVSDHDCSYPLSDAQEECPSRLKQAASRLKAALEQADMAHNGIAEGLLLEHDCKHWHLHDCFSCRGSGRVDCYTCHGQKKETCWHCHGSLQISCDAFGCFGGRLNCTTCSGSGQVSHQVSYQTSVQVPTTTWNNGVSHTSYHTEYRTEYRTERRTCTAYGCQYGKIQCSRCFGTGRINCTTCFSTGKVTCRTCSGIGDLRCEPCSGSGKLGNAAWVDVYATPTYHLQLPENSPDDAQAIVEKEGPHGVASISQSMDLAKTELDTPENPGRLTALYRGLLRIVRLDTRCNAHDYHLIAYGNDLRWMTTDAMVEDLLRDDLDALQTALSETADDNLFASRIEHLLLPLKHVTASELNADVIEAALGYESEQAHKEIVSAEYVRDIQKSILGALRQIYTRIAKQLWWQVALACLATTATLWAVSTPLWGMLGGALTLAGASFFFTRRVRRILNDALGSPALAERAMSIAHKSKRTHMAHTLILAPGAIGTLALGTLLPAQGLLPDNKPATPPGALIAPHTALPAKAAPQPATAAAPATMANALTDYKQGRLEAARSQFKQLAEQGNSEAFGPYGWMILNLEGLSSSAGITAENQRALAKPWLDKGIAHNDPWAQAGLGLMLTQAWGVERNMSQGLELLEHAANAGHVRAMHDIGLIHGQGFHVPVNMAKARKWFTLAADRGRAEDIYNVGLMDWRGDGIDQPNQKRALERWAQAAKLGEPRAKEALAKGRPHNE